ncbi:metallophosphoesterase family protein [Candidatus Halobonum tyrrellensis]|uniref:Calcineurin-like phosphoesterase n=1 Tax=Candidatus Halobonum tyrrellensis G22 TaxID=1324957 RepID=V4HIU1_9EURY|nr:metallophosphoesterase family protein [Candidatus Halobonum tyrrellensis]ESP87814.1 calcineurin-like phosphoesterase [Candidatus Halobonum tyrrellensis G22]
MTAPRFAPEIESFHRRIDPDDWQRIYVVGDVHGCPDALDRLLDELGVTDDDLVVFVGDLVRKGPDSRSVVERVRNAPNAVSVRGNNEEKLIRGEKRLPGLSDDQLAWIEGCPVAVSWPGVDDRPGALVVHGGVDPRKPLAEHSVDDLQNARSLVPGGSYGDRPYWWERYDGPHRVFFGHTVLARPVDRPFAVGLDTGCVYGGDLTAYDWYADAFVSVPAAVDGDRADEKVLRPPFSDAESARAEGVGPTR